jgi:hypothetical protein
MRNASGIIEFPEAFLRKISQLKNTFTNYSVASVFVAD